MAKKDTHEDTSKEQVELLRGIWNEIKSLGQTLGSRIDQTNERLDAVRTELSGKIDQTNARLDETNVRIDAVRTELKDEIAQVRTELIKRISESEVRTATAIISLEGTLRDVRDLLRTTLDLGPRVTRCEEDIRDLRARIESVAQE